MCGSDFGTSNNQPRRFGGRLSTKRFVGRSCRPPRLSASRGGIFSVVRPCDGARNTRSNEGPTSALRANLQGIKADGRPQGCRQQRSVAPLHNRLANSLDDRATTRPLLRLCSSGYSGPQFLALGNPRPTEQNEVLAFDGSLSSGRAHTRGDTCACSIHWPQRCNALLPAPYLKAITHIRTGVGQENGDCGGDRIGRGLKIV
jgi:hypothetical protein